MLGSTRRLRTQSMRPSSFDAVDAISTTPFLPSRQDTLPTIREDECEDLEQEASKAHAGYTSYRSS